MKQWDIVNFSGCDWRYIGKESSGIRLRSLSKHLSDVIVDFSREKMINTGEYKSHGR